jgi:nicotinamide mononucleotide adenylyltransferase
MSFLWEHSRAYRAIVRSTSTSKASMAAFAFVTMVVVPIGAATVVQSATNPDGDAARDEMIRKRGTIDSDITYKSNANKLNAMLGDVRDGVNGDQRWREALGIEKPKR